MPSISRQVGSIKSKNQTDNHSTQAIAYDDKSESEINLSYMNFVEIPHTLKDRQTYSLNLSHNEIKYGQIDNNIPQTDCLDLSNNGMFELRVKSMKKIKKNYQYNQLSYDINLNKLWLLKILYLQNNQIEYLNLEELKGIEQLDCSHNQISSIRLPQNSFIHTIKTSHNKLTNIIQSLAGQCPQRNLQYLDISHNQVQDLILGLNYQRISGQKCSSYFPKLNYLNCSHNFVCFISQLPFQLREFHIANNDLTIDRLMAKNIAQIQGLKILDIDGNSIDRTVFDFLGNALPSCIIEPTHQKSEILTPNNILRQSPYRLYYSDDDEKQKIDAEKTQNISHLNFTLGEELLESEIQHCEPSYEMASIPRPETQQILVQTPAIQQDSKNKKQMNSLQPIDQNEDKMSVEQRIKAVGSGTKQKIAFKVEDREQKGHHLQLLRKVTYFSMMPPQPIKHSERQKHISKRLNKEISQNQSQFQVVEKLFDKFYGVHYIRKIFNASLSPLLQNSVVEESFQMHYVIREWSKSQFSKLCQGQLNILKQENIGLLSISPNNFSKYHVLVRTKKANKDKYARNLNQYGCIYLVQCAQH